MQTPPVLNITIPVFNRYEATQKAILALRRTNSDIPFVVTVVDNGSDSNLVDRLVAMRRGDLIDNLFLLPQNYGVSCAANVGWAAVDTPYYMKLDNDIVMRQPDWPTRLFNLWSHGEPLSTLGPVHSEKELNENPGALHTPDGTLGICLKNLQGQAIIIPRVVKERLGRWSEDYGLYGAEDGDYGLRMKHFGLPQYYYLSTGLYDDLGTEDQKETYNTRNVNRKKEYESLFQDEKGGIGFFRLNAYLYGHGIRSPKVALRYQLADVDENFRANIIERKEYRPVRRALEECKRLMDEKIRSRREREFFYPEFMDHLKKIMRACGQECSMPEGSAI